MVKKEVTKGAIQIELGANEYELFKENAARNERSIKAHLRHLANEACRLEYSLQAQADSEYLPGNL